MSEKADVSLAEIIYIFIKRKYYFVIGFTFTLLFSLLILAKVSTDIPHYFSVYRVSVFDGKEVTDVESLVSRLENSFYFEMIAFDPLLDELMGKTVISSPKKSGVIKVRTKGRSKDEIVSFHRIILSYLENQDREAYGQVILEVENKLKNLESDYVSTENNYENSTLGKFSLKKISLEIENLKNKVRTAKEGAILVESSEVKSKGKKSNFKRVSIAIIVSVFSGLFFVIIAEAISVIRKELQHLSKN